MVISRRSYCKQCEIGGKVKRTKPNHGRVKRERWPGEGDPEWSNCQKCGCVFEQTGRMIVTVCRKRCRRKYKCELCRGQYELVDGGFKKSIKRRFCSARCRHIGIRLETMVRELDRIDERIDMWVERTKRWLGSPARAHRPVTTERDCRACGKSYLPPTRNAAHCESCSNTRRLIWKKYRNACMPLRAWNSLAMELKYRDGHRCQYCLTNMAEEIDHLIPLSRNGDPADTSNLVSACFECNRRKGNRTPLEFFFEVPVPQVEIISNEELLRRVQVFRSSPGGIRYGKPILPEIDSPLLSRGDHIKVSRRPKRSQRLLF